jgi:putative DNA primase/helicase
MQELFKGYLPTRNKQPLIKFEKAAPLSDVVDDPEYAGLLADNVILIDIDDYEQSEILMDIVEDLQLNCRVYATTRGKHFMFYGGNHDRCGTHIKLAIGIEADIKIGAHNSISVLKYDNKLREIIYDIEEHEEYEEAPDWLLPVRSKVDFLNLGAGDGRNQTLFNYILTLQSAEISNDDIKTAITLINKYVLPEPLSDSELDKILRDDSFKKPVFYGKNGQLLFNVFAAYIKNNHHVIKLDNQLHIFKDGVYISGYDAIEKEMIKIIPTLTARNRSEVLKYLELIAPEVKSTADANYIAFNNGIYNLEAEKLEEFSPHIIVKNKIAHDYNYDAYNEAMDGMLDRISCHDDSIRDLLEEMSGYCMYRRNELRKAFILIGDKANGKSTFLDCIANMLGDENVSSLDLNELGDRFRTAELFGKLVNVGDDIGDDFIPNPAVFKKVVSGDRLTVERKGQHPFDFNNYSKLLFSANNIPRMKDKTGAVLDRLVIVPFNANFSKNDKDYDPYIKYKLRTDEAMQYLIQISLDGLKRVLANNSFTICKKVQDELDTYNEENNPIVGFFKDLDEDEIENQPTKDIYARYKLYCNENNFTPISHIQFTKYIKKELGMDVRVMRVKNKTVKVFRSDASE